MTNPTAKPNRHLHRILMAGGAGLVAITVGVYGILGGYGNSQSANSCAVSLAMAENAAPHVGGEVAAFLPAERPLDLSALAFQNDKGESRTLASFSGRTVLLNLWATWCGPCRKEMPALDQLQAERGGKDFEVVAVSVDRGSEEKPKAFLEEMGIHTLAFRHDPSNQIIADLRKVAKAPGLPTTILVGPDGCEVGTMYGPAEWASGEAKGLIDKAIEAARPAS